MKHTAEGLTYLKHSVGEVNRKFTSFFQVKVRFAEGSKVLAATDISF